MRFSLGAFILCCSINAGACLFEIENADLDTTCSSDVTSYELDTYYALRPPRLKFIAQSEYDRVRIGGRTTKLPASITIFDKQDLSRRTVAIEFLKGTKLYRKVILNKIPHDFPEMQVEGEASPGFFLLAPTRFDGRRSFALILDHKGNVIFFRAFDKAANNFRKQGAYFTISLIERMLPTSAMGVHVVYNNPLEEIHRFSGKSAETRWGQFFLDVHDMIYLNPEHYFYIKTYPEDDLFWGCVYHNEIVEYRDGKEKVIFSSRPYLKYENLSRLRWPILMSVHQCKNYFYLNAIQNIEGRLFLLSSRATNGVHLWSDLSPVKIWDLGAQFKNQFSNLTVLDWVGQHTPHYFAETNQIILFDNGQAPNLSSLAYNPYFSSLVLIDLDDEKKPVKSERLAIFGSYQASSMGSVDWYDRDTIVIGTGHSFGERPFDLAELKLGSRSLVYKVKFKDPHVMNYRVYKVRDLGD